MPLIVLLIQWCVVLAVPAFFGGVVLRRLAREHDWRIAVGGGVVLGQAALMILLNALRFFWEMGPALWLAYQLLLVGSVLVITLTPPPRKTPPPATKRPWVKIALPLGGAVLAAVYFGVPAFRGLLHDAWWFHYPTAVRVQTIAQFPLSPPFAPNDLLYYHYGPDLQAATLGQALHLQVADSFALLIVLHVLAGFLLACGLVHRIARNYWAGLVAATLLYFGGNLRFLLLPFADWNSPLDLLQVFNSQTVDGLLKLVFTPSHAVGIPLALASLAVFRRMMLRPSWAVTVLLGLLLGSMSLVAEWYFLPLIGALGIHGLAELWRARRKLSSRLRGWRLVGALAIAGACCFFNGGYLAGLFAHYWMPRDSFNSLSTTRQWDGLPSRDTYLTNIAAPKIAPPPLVPLRLNLSRLGTVPSWEGAQSTGGTFIALWSPKFLLEALPLLLTGLGFAVWALRRSQSPVLRALALITLVSCIPPTLLDWGYRSTDFLRFFTGAVAFGSLLAGILLVRLWSIKPPIGRVVVLAGLFVALVNCAGLGLLGLMPSTFARAKSLNDSGSSLAEAKTGTASIAIDQTRALSRLGEKVRIATRPLSHGRENLVVVLPEEKLPPCEKFPEWLKLTTLTEAPIPIGWFWNESLYTHYYRNAATRLDPVALVALDARWVIVTNLFGEYQPPAVVEALRSGTFIRVARFVEGDYFLELYRVRRPLSPRK